MDVLLTTIIIPFILSALIVIIITLIAERYGTKIGGIIGTLPSTIVIPFLFIAYHKGIPLTIEAVSVVPAEMAINLVFLFLFAVYAPLKTPKALLISLVGWTILTLVLLFTLLTTSLFRSSFFL